MAAPAYATVDEYLAAQPEPVAEALTAARNAIRSAIPDAEECISYNMPAYKINGKAVVHLAGWKNHYSVYPASDALVAALGDELKECTVVECTIKFSYKKPVPTELIQRIAEFRAMEVQAKAKK